MPFDLVIAIDSPTYSMLEIINLQHEGENIWFTLESLNTCQQIIGLPSNKQKRQIIQRFAKIMNTTTYEANLAVKHKKGKLNVSFNQKDFVTKKSNPVAFEIKYPEKILEEENNIFHALQ